jgi:ATP-binding cassette subfamily B protein
MHWHSFHRARRFGSPPLSTRFLIYGSSVAAALLIVLLILAFGAITDLATSRGNLSIDARKKDDLRQLAELAGPPDTISADQAHYVGRGMLPVVWPLNPTMFGGIAARMFEYWPAMRRNETCLGAIVVIGWCLSLLLAIALYVLERAVRRSARETVRRIRQALYEQSVQLGAGDLLLGQKQNAVDLFVERVEILNRGLALWSRAIPQAILLIALLLLTALYVDPWLTVAAVLLAVLSWLMLEGLRNNSRRRAKYWGDVAAQQRDTLVEDLRQVPSLANFASPVVAANGSFAERLQNCHIASVREHASPSLNEPAVLLFALFGAWLILLLGALNVLTDPPRVLYAGTIVLGTSIVTMLYPLRLLHKIWLVLPATENAAADIMAYLDRRPGIGQFPDAKPLPPPTKQLALVNVRLADAAGAKLLDDVSLAIRCGSRTAILASDRETPFALAGLLPRFYDPTAGRVLFDGHDIGRATIASVRSQVGVLMPGQILVTGTVSENITCGEPRLSAREVLEAARQSLAYDFIQKLPHGFETVVGKHGLHLSAAEAMLVGIARLLARNPAVAVVGESAERSDPAIEDMLLTAFNRLAANRTLVVLARRLTTLRSAERILLFHEGKLHAEGSHAELLAESELYRHLNYVRFNEFRDQVSGQW